MESVKSMPVLIPVERGEFIEKIRVVVREEIERFMFAQMGGNGRVVGMTYKPLYKMDEVCELFEVTPPTIYDWIKHGKLKPKKIRSRVFFLWEDIQELLRQKVDYKK